MTETVELKREVVSSTPHVLCAMVQAAIRGLLSMMQLKVSVSLHTIKSIRKIEQGLLSSVGGSASTVCTPISDADSESDVVVKLMILHDAVAAILGEDPFSEALDRSQPRSAFVPFKES